MTGAKRVALYLRVSTGEQTTDMQRRDLMAACERRGWSVVAEFADEGISGSKGRDQRPGFDRLHKAITRGQVDIVAAWSVDRLGRSLQDLVALLGEIHGAGIDLYLDRQGLDTSTPAGRALFGMLGVFAEFERALITERVRSGIAKARVVGTRSGKAIGRPAMPDDLRRRVYELLAGGAGVRQAARLTGASLGSVSRIKLGMAPAMEIA